MSAGVVTLVEKKSFARKWIFWDSLKESCNIPAQNAFLVKSCKDGWFFIGDLTKITFPCEIFARTFFCNNFREVL